jgi:hypothetical protein
VPFDRAVARLAEDAGINIVADWGELTFPARGVYHDSTVRLNLRDVTLAQALTAMLRSFARADTLGYGVRDGIIVISSPYEIAGPDLRLRLYDVRDLLRDAAAWRRTFPRPPSSGADEDAEDNDDIGEIDDTDFWEAREELIDLLQQADPGSWVENGGLGTMRRWFESRLLVEQTPGGHHKIEAMLDALRRRVGTAGPAPATGPTPAATGR